MAKVHISSGNMKVGKLPNMSLAPGKSCTKCACETCLKDCYAMKSYRMYPGTKNAWDDNTEIALSNPGKIEKELNLYLAKKKPELFRIHVAGDFITKEYAAMWSRVVKANPNVRFLAFTKAWDNIRDIDWPTNISIVLSGWPGTKVPEDLKEKYPVAWMDDGSEGAVDTKKTVLNCPGNCETCGMCWELYKTNCDVCFKKH